MTIRTLIMLIGLAGLGSACSAGSPVEAEADLTGTWNWVESEGGFAGGIRTPETDGIERTVTFRTDGIVRVVENGVQTVETTWEVAIAPVGTAHAGKRIVRYGAPTIGFEEQAYEFPAPDTLVLDDGCCDGFVHTFVRASP